MLHKFASKEQKMDQEKDKKSKRLMDATLGDLAEILAGMGFQINGKSDSFTKVQPELMDVEACSALTGYSAGYIRQLVFKRAIPFYKNENRKPVRFKRSEILAWMVEKKFQPIESLADEHIHSYSKRKR